MRMDTEVFEHISTWDRVVPCRSTTEFAEILEHQPRHKTILIDLDAVSFSPAMVIELLRQKNPVATIVGVRNTTNFTSEEYEAFYKLEGGMLVDKEKIESCMHSSDPKNALEELFTEAITRASQALIERQLMKRDIAPLEHVPGVSINEAAMQCYINGKEVALSPSCFFCLTCLIRSVNKDVKTSDIVTYIKSIKANGKELTTTRASVQQYIVELRRILENVCKIETLNRYGYKLVPLKHADKSN